MTKDGQPEQMQVFAEGLNRPYGIAFYPPGPDPQWIYIGNTNELVRFPYHNGDLKASGAPQHISASADPLVMIASEPQFAHRSLLPASEAIARPLSVR